MSEIVHTTGTLTPLHTGKALTLESACALVCDDEGWERLGGETWATTVQEEGYSEYHVGKDTVYKVSENELDPNADIARATARDDGTIDFELRYYNGGAGQSEMLDLALKRMNKEYSQ